MATHKPIGHVSKQHHGQAEKYGMAEQEFSGKQKKSAVPEKKHRADGESNPSLSNAAGGLDY
jgi:hypothetical protein